MEVDYNLYAKQYYEPSHHSYHHHHHHHSSSVAEHYSKDLRQIISSRYCKSYANNHPPPPNPHQVPPQHHHCETEINNPYWTECASLSSANCHHFQHQNPSLQQQHHHSHLCHNSLVADSGLSNNHHHHHHGLQTNGAASSSEHVINLYDLNSNRSVDYIDYGHYNDSATFQESESYHYNQYENNYCCYNLESHAPISWIDTDYCRPWDGDLNPAMQPPHYPSPKTISPMVMPFSSHQNAPGIESNFTRESVQYKDTVDLGSTVPRYSLHGSVNLNPNLSQCSANPNLFLCQSTSARLPIKEFNKTKLNQNSIHSSMSVNLAMNMSVPQSLIDNHKQPLSAIQMRTHSAQYKLTAQLSEHITIKKHKFTDLYRVSRNPGESTLYGQIKQVKLNQINQTNQNAFRNEHRYQDSNNSNCDNDDLDRTNLCMICGKTYARPSTLKTHLRTHSGEKPYRCSICNKAFSQAANLTAHVRTHSGEKPFPCPICHRKFSQSSSVTTHLRTHSGERPYRCNFCRKAFSDSSTLTKHLRIHSGEKPYQCRICFLRFSQSGNLNRHMRIHV